MGCPDIISCHCITHQSVLCFKLACTLERQAAEGDVDSSVCQDELQ